MSPVKKPATIAELVEASGKSKPTVYRLIASGELPGYRTSRGYVIPRVWFERWQRGEWHMPAPPAEEPEASEPIDFLKRRQPA
jgi:excisionase family DNA binding protein